MDFDRPVPRRSQRRTQGLLSEGLQGSLRRGATVNEERAHGCDILAEGRIMRENESNERKATRAARLAAIPPLPTTPEHLRETIDEDDLCPICQQLLHQPVKTTCNHTMSIVDVDEEPVAFDAVAGLEAKCPMCRQQTSAALDAARGNHLDTAYPRTARRRRVEEENDTLSEGREGGIQTMTVYIGNRHHQIEASDANQYDWTFFVRPSRPEMIEEVHIDLHPTFNPPRIIRGRPPYDIRRLGWGTFTITANVMLKAGYSWLSGDAIDSPDGAKKGTLPLEWTLDFSGFGGKGSMGRLKLKVKAEKDLVGAILDDARDDGDWRRAMRQYERDGGWNPQL